MFSTQTKMMERMKEAIQKKNTRSIPVPTGQQKKISIQSLPMPPASIYLHKTAKKKPDQFYSLAHSHFSHFSPIASPYRFGAHPYLRLAGKHYNHVPSRNGHYPYVYADRESKISFLTILPSSPSAHHIYATQANSHKTTLLFSAYAGLHAWYTILDAIRFLYATVAAK